MKYPLFAALMFFLSAVHAQQPKITELTLTEALELAQSRNFELKESMASVAIAKSQQLSARAAFLPHVELSENYVNTNDPLHVFGLKLKQGIVTGNDFSPELLNDPNSMGNFSTRVLVEQPILNFDAFSQKSALKNFYEASQMSHYRNSQHVRYLIKKNYFALLVTLRSIEAAKKSVENTQEALEIARDHLDAGYILQSDLLAAEVRWLSAKNQLSVAESQYYDASRQFKYLLGLDSDLNLVLTDSLSAPVTPLFREDSVSILESRSDIRALTLVSEGQKKMLQAAKFQYLPNLNAMLSYEWNDETAFGNHADNYLLGVGLTWNLFDGYKREAEIQKSKSELHKSQISLEKQRARADIELGNALKQLEISYDQIHTHKLAVDRAEKLFKIKKDRYAAGLETTADLIDAETNLYQQNIALQGALYRYYDSIFTIEFLIEKDII